MLSIVGIAALSILPLSAEETNTSSGTRDSSNSPQQDPLAQLILPFQPGDEVEKQVALDLAPIDVRSSTLHSLIVSRERYVLSGDLFKNGRLYALIQLPSVAGTSATANDDGRVALAEYIRGSWQLRGLWKIGVYWLSKSWQEDENSHLFQTPPKQPFELVDFIGDGTSQVLFAGSPERYFHFYYFLRYDAEKDTLKLLAKTDHKPSGGNGYMVATTGSGRRANTSEERYFKWENGKLVLRAISRDVEQEGDGEGPDIYTVISAYRNNGIQENYKIVSDPNRATITKDGTDYAIIRFNFTKQVSGDGNPAQRMQDDWIFERLTTLPRNLYQPAELVPGQISWRIEEYATITVKGSSDAIRQLSPNKGPIASKRSVLFD